MNNRILMILLTSVVVSMTSGCCGPFRNFFFGRGAKCGMCNQPPAPMLGGAPLAPPAQPKCNVPGRSRPSCLFGRDSQPDAGCGCQTDACQGSQVVDSYGSGCGCGNNEGAIISGYGSDPYSSTVIGNGVMGETIMEGQTIYGGGDQFVPAPVDNEGYRTNYPSAYDQGYKTDRDGLRIIHEDPMPPGAMAVN